MRNSICKSLLIICSSSLFAANAFAKDNQPNVVVILMDNFGYGELGCYGGGITRGAPTPRIDQLASQGFRSTNFNVEAQCTPSRAALLTGRYAIRTGNAVVPIEPSEYGLVQWEYTLAEMFAEQNYATGIFGKWHLGDSPGRYPIDQGFDEWYGIPNSTDEAFWPDNPRFEEGLHPLARYEHVLSGKKGEEVKQIEVYDLKKRALIDDEFTTKAIDFMQRSHRAGKPFFTFIPYTQTHMPVNAHPDFAGKTKNGKWADILAQTDAYVGRILDAIDQMGVADDTIVIFTADNGPEGQEPHEGFSGMWRGSYFTALEGSLRVPFIMRWPGKIPAGMVSNEIVHEIDLLPTLASVVGGRVPDDRAIDGFDQTAFLTGKEEKSKRESVIVYVGSDIYGVKWKDWKIAFKELDTGFGQPVKQYQTPVVYDLLEDPKEMRPVRSGPPNYWIRYPALEYLGEHIASLKKYPPVPADAKVDYQPPTKN